MRTAHIFIFDADRLLFFYVLLGWVGFYFEHNNTGNAANIVTVSQCVCFTNKVECYCEYGNAANV